MRQFATALWATLAVGLVLSGVGTLAADEPPAAPAAPASGPVELEIQALVEAVARKTGLVFGWSPDQKQIRQQRVRLTDGAQAAGNLDLAGLRRLLAVHELVVVPLGPPEERVHWLQDMRQQGVMLRLAPEPIVLDESTYARYAHADGLFVTAQIRTSGTTNLRDLRAAVSRLVTAQNIGSVTELPEAETLVVTDFAPNVCAVYRFVRDADALARAAPARTSRLVRLAHADATETAQVLHEALVASRQGPPPPAPQAGAAPASSGSTSLRVVADVRTNQLLVSGTTSEVEGVLDLVKGLDIPVALPKEPPPSPAVARTADRALDQRVTINLLDARLQDALDAITRVAGLKIVSAVPVIDHPKVSLAVNDMPVREVLDVLLANYALAWQAQGAGRIVLTAK
jgi:hypothetical protein